MTEQTRARRFNTFVGISLDDSATNVQHTIGTGFWQGFSLKSPTLPTRASLLPVSSVHYFTGLHTSQDSHIQVLKMTYTAFYRGETTVLDVGQSISGKHWRTKSLARVRGEQHPD